MEQESYTQEELDAATQAEQNVQAQAVIQHLQSRTVALHVELRRRDARIAELEQELAQARRSAEQDSGPDSAP